MCLQALEFVVTNAKNELECLSTTFLMIFVSYI